jgi:DNA-binding IclR family transcriptional regulator
MRSSPGVKRVAAILNFMANHPGQSFSLTDLVRALKLSRATCHAILSGLVEVGYLYRTSERTYVLGPALSVIARAVADNSSPLKVAQPEMRILADEFDVVCSAVFLEGDMVEVRARAESVSHLGRSVPVGTRLKLRTPFAAGFFAWTPAREVKAWLAAARPKPTEDQLKLQRLSMEFARKHGFVLLLQNSRAKPERLTEQLFEDDNMEFPMTPASELKDGKAYPVMTIQAPVFDPSRRVAFVLAMMGFDRAMNKAEILAIADRLRGACERVGGAISSHRGHEPFAA